MRSLTPALSCLSLIPAIDITTSLLASQELVIVAGPAASSFCVAVLRCGETRAINDAQVRPGQPFCKQAHIRWPRFTTTPFLAFPRFGVR